MRAGRRRRRRLGSLREAEGAPAYWPWRQVLRSLGLDPDTVLTGDVESPRTGSGCSKS